MILTFKKTRKYKVIEAKEYLKKFSSDREHMRKNGQWLAPPPKYPPIQIDGTPSPSPSPPSPSPYPSPSSSPFSFFSFLFVLLLIPLILLPMLL